jgi:ankyrin repeat protein
MMQLDKLFQQDSQYLAAVLQIKMLRGGLDYSSIVQHFDHIQFSVSASTIVYSTSLYSVPILRQRWVGEASPIYALQLASSAGLNTAVIRLLDAGCEINERDGEGRTPLYHACLQTHLEIVQTLLSAGADVFAQGGHYGNALQAASAGGHEQIVKLLLEKNADVNAQGGQYGNALQAASAGGHKRIVKLLLEKNADVNAQGGDYGNALQAASAFGREQIVKLLQSHVVDTKVPDQITQTPLPLATESGSSSSAPPLEH